MELAAGYAPQNFYCFSVDKKANPIFKENLYNLVDCFPNVFIAPIEHDVHRAGKNLNVAHMDCLELLRKYSWKYVMVLEVSYIFLFFFCRFLRLKNSAKPDLSAGILRISMCYSKPTMNWCKFLHGSMALTIL